MELSNRILNITQGGSDGWEVLYRARDMIRDGIDVYDLTQGEHDIKTETAILDAMDASVRAGHTGYSPVAGEPELRQAIASRVQAQTSVETKPSNVMVTTGGQAALFAAHAAVLDHGDTGLYCDPYYATYGGVIRAVGAKAQTIPTQSSNDFKPTKEALNAHAPNARSLLINSPNNPTGVVYGRETLTTIADVCKAHDLWLISDEVYDCQVWDRDHISPRSLPDMAERTIVIGSMSKSHAMTGFRCGWVIAPEDVVDHIFNLSNVTTYGVAGFVQQAALFALTHGTDIERRVADVFRRRRILTQDALKNIPALRLIPSSGAMYQMIDIQATGMTGQEFAFKLLEKHKIAVMPGESFGPSAAGHIRVALTLEDSKLVVALHILAEFAQQQTSNGVSHATT